MFKIVCKVMNKESGKKWKRITLSMKINETDNNYANIIE